MVYDAPIWGVFVNFHRSAFCTQRLWLGVSLTYREATRLQESLMLHFRQFPEIGKVRDLL